MRIVIIGAAGFIGINLIKTLASSDNELVLVDRNEEFFLPIKRMGYKSLIYKIMDFSDKSSFLDLFEENDVVYHLASTNIPATSNKKIPEEIYGNVVVSSLMLDACVRKNVSKVIFISSGGTVYGNQGICPLKEDSETLPISSYGLQKITIEKLLYLYNYLYGLDYRCVRLSNPYGPYQRPNSGLGVVTTFIYKLLNNEKITIYGDGSVIRDFLYIEDAIKGIICISGDSSYKTYNLGCGYGTSIMDLVSIMQKTLNIEGNIEFLPGRKNDVPINYLDISRFEESFGKFDTISLENGILKTADFLRKNS